MKNTETGALEKCRAVLAVWTERRQASELCREMGISASLLSQWQERALSGMVEALEPRGSKEGDAGPALSMQMRRLLERKIRAMELAGAVRAVGRRPRGMKVKQESSVTEAAS